MEHVGEKAILVVAQEPFDHVSEFGSVNSFATLVPLVTVDGAGLERSDFRHHGLVFWLVRPQLLGVANPGRLVSGRLEGAVNPQAGHEYQLAPDSAEIVQPSDAIEVLTVENPSAVEPRDLVNIDSLLILDHAPTPLVLVRWREEVWGPFRVEVAPHDALSSRWKVSLRTHRPDQKVFRIPAAHLTATDRFGAHYLANLQVPVRTDNRDPAKYMPTRTCQYSILLGSGFKRLPSLGYQLVSVETDKELLLRYARRFSSRRELQRLRDILNAIDSSLDPLAADVSEAEARVFDAVKRQSERLDGELSALANALVHSGLIDSHIAAAINVHVQEYIRQQGETLSAEINGRLAALRAEIEVVERRRNRIEEELDSRRRQAEHELEAKLNAFEKYRLGESERLDKSRQNLEAERDALSRHLEQVIERYRSSRESLFVDFIALAPLLERAGFSAAAKSQSPPDAAEDRRPSEPLSLPPSILAADSDPLPSCSESQFFERFERHAKESGFSYRRIDLVSFHISVKCCDLTILGGPSGTGKSSLPLLYAEALAGDQPTATITDRFLHVGVSPGWLDMRDLIGHVNSLERRFEPSETGLLRHLIFAHQESLKKQLQSGIYVVTLDEMNLAHVEYYFSGFLQALEQKGREIRFFDPSSVAPESTFAPYSLLSIPRSIRFVGTVNFDETTKQLSARVLDRANLIHLRPTDLTVNLGSTTEQRTAVAGPSVRLQHFREWRRTAPLDRDLAAIYDKAQQYLAKLGAPITPRRRQAILEFVASTPSELATPLQAFDLQIAQRLLPQVRGLYRPHSKNALDALARDLSQHSYGFPESMAAIRELVQTEHVGMSMFDSADL